MILTVLQIGVSSTRIFSEITENDMNFDNSPPNKPIIRVPDKIISGKWFKIEAEITDPDGDDIYIRFNASIIPDLPVFWLGPLPSGLVYKSWVRYRGPAGVYTIGVQAKDIYDAESEWTYVQFNITKSRIANIQFYNFLQGQLYLYPILKLIIQRIA